jgi:hypothetical protein
LLISGFEVDHKKEAQFYSAAKLVYMLVSLFAQLHAEQSAASDVASSSCWSFRKFLATDVIMTQRRFAIRL